MTIHTSSIIVRRTLPSVLVIALLAMAGRAWGLFNSTPFFPLTDLTRRYVVDGSSTSTVIVVPGTTTINNIATKRFQSSLASTCTTTEMFHTNSVLDGIRLHRIVAPDVVILGSPRQVTVTFDPPVVLATGITDVDFFSFTEGTAEVVVSEVGTFASNSAALFQVVDTLPVTVPAGTFNNALRLEGVIIIEDPTIGTLQVSFSPIQLAKDVGTVRSVVSLLNGASATSELASLPSGHAVGVTCGPNGIPNPVASGGTVNLNAEAIDSQGHTPLNFVWTAFCPTLGGDIPNFSPGPNVQTPTWTAPANLTGSPQSCTIQVTVDDGLGVNTTGSFLQSVNSVPHDLTITNGPTGLPNPVASGGTVNLSVAATDSLGHALTYAWTADCPAALVGDGSFNNAALQTPTWTAPTNITGIQQDCTMQVTVSDGMGKTQSPSYIQTVNSVQHQITITSPPSGVPNPVASGGTANLSVAATDSQGHPLTYAWSASCLSLPGNGSFNDPTLQTPTWTAPTNTTGIQQNCTIGVTVSDPGPVLSQSPSFSQGVSPEGMGPSEPPVPQLLNVMTLSGPGGAEQQTFLPTDPILAEVTYFDPNPTCAGVAPVLLQLLVFNLEGQLILTREDVTSAPIAPGSKYRLLSATLAPGALAPGAYSLIFLVRDCTSTNFFVSGAYAIRVLP